MKVQARPVRVGGADQTDWLRVTIDDRHIGYLRAREDNPDDPPRWGYRALWMQSYTWVGRKADALDGLLQADR